METPEQSLHTPEDGPNEMPLSSMENTSNTEVPQEPTPELEPNIEIPKEVPAQPEPQEFPLPETEISEEPSSPEVPDANLTENHTPENSNEQHTIVDQLITAEESEAIAEIEPAIIENHPVSETEPVAISAILEEEEVNDDSNEE